MKQRKEAILKDAIDCAWNIDCNGGQGTYHTSAYCDRNGILPAIQKDIDDDTVSAEQFKNLHIKNI